MLAQSSDRETQALVIGGTILRVALGVLFLATSIGKFTGGYGHYLGFMRHGFEKTWLPLWTVMPFTYVLPFVEIILAVTLILGLFTRPMLTIAGALLIMLGFGMMVQGNPPIAAGNFNYVLIAAVALWMSSHGNPWSLDHLRELRD